MGQQHFYCALVSLFCDEAHGDEWADEHHDQAAIDEVFTKEYFLEVGDGRELVLRRSFAHEAVENEREREAQA